MPNNMVLLETIALTQSAASVTFDNLPTSGYTDLKVVMSANCTGSGATADDIRIRFNGNTSASYSMRSINGSGSAASSASESGQTSSWCGNIGGTGSIYNNAEIYIPNYLSTSNAKSTSVDNVVEANATAAPMRLIAQLWNPGTQAAITSILLYPSTFSWSAGSTFSIYGVAALGTTPVLAPKATGGNIVANDGTYWYHAFTSSGNFVPQTGLTADVLQIGGGGGGGAFSGGGGAGGVSYISATSLTSGTSNAVTIGGGGTGAIYATITPALNGNNSQFASLTAALGGGGAGASTNAVNANRNGRNGGCGGGGGGSDPGYGGSLGGVGSQGGNGAIGQATNNGQGGGGGGGAGGNGTAGSSSTPAPGGVGTSAYSSWGLATNTGQNVSGTVFYAGGGGGFANYGISNGGNGGGGAGYGNTDLGQNGTANTGGGAGGTYASPGRTGGSGIVIIRYPIN